MLNKIVIFLIQFCLTLLFFVFVTPAGLILRKLGVDYMSRNFDKASPSYWMDKK